MAIHRRCQSASMNDCYNVRQVAAPKYSIVRKYIVYRPIAMIFSPNWPEWRTLLPGDVESRNFRLEAGKTRPFLVSHVLRKVQTAVTWLVIAGATRSDRYVILASLAYLARLAAGCMRKRRADYVVYPLQGFPRLVQYCVCSYHFTLLFFIDVHYEQLVIK